ncbi:hypothetical protein AB834_02070 [PVC group bacterium (ex Bugula neritina AB1)]|nr:hypothetical protein AB834_02070 [PVC group bacterium (ex Bugula neritina AB1)]
MIFFKMLDYFQGRVETLNKVLCEASGLCHLGDLTGKHFLEQLSYRKIFGRNVIKDLYFGGRKSHVPRVVIDTYRSVINDAPPDIKKDLNSLFEKRIYELGWVPFLEDYFFKNFGYNDDWSISNVEDHSIGAGVYCLTFLLKDKNKSVDLFLKREFDDGFTLKHESFYHAIQAKFIHPEFIAPQPVYYHSQQGNSLSVAERFPGISSETFFRFWMTGAQKIDIEINDIFVTCLAKHAAMGDVLGRNDRHLGNSHLASVTSSGEETKDLNIFMDINESQKLWMIDFDIQYLLESNSDDWILEDIRQGLSEINLLPFLLEVSSSSKNSLKRCLSLFHEVYITFLNQIKTPKSLEWIESFAQNIYGQDFAKQLTLSLSHKVDFLMTMDWKKDYYRAFLVDYRYRFFLKNLLEDKFRRNPSKNEWIEYIDAKSSKGAAFQLEAFRGVSAKNFVSQKKLGFRKNWEDLELKLRVFLGKEDFFKARKRRDSFLEEFFEILF